jgi:hypothetical protein
VHQQFASPLVEVTGLMREVPEEVILLVHHLHQVFHFQRIHPSQ